MAVTITAPGPSGSGGGGGGATVKSGTVTVAGSNNAGDGTASVAFGTAFGGVTPDVTVSFTNGTGGNGERIFTDGVSTTGFQVIILTSSNGAPVGDRDVAWHATDAGNA